MTRSILIVEDDPDGQEVLARMLFRAQFTIELTSNAEDALKILQGQAYAAIVIDLALPGMDGFALLEQIRQRNDDLPCVAITAFHTPMLKQRVMAHGFNAYFAKPIDDHRFVDELNVLLQSPPTT